MNRFSKLPELIVAPNGARKTKKDHPNLPITITEIVEEADKCFKCGANAIHAHIRDKNESHTLDPGLYRELIKELKIKVPNMPVQITTESVGKYSPREQFDVVKTILPESASVAFIEMLPDIKDYKLAKDFYEFSSDNNVQVQHILYSVKDLKYFIQAIKSKIISNENLQVLYVLGRYDTNFQSRTEDLDLFIQEHKSIISFVEWGICAFGEAETDCLMKSYSLGGKARVGFENNFKNADGTIADTNADRVSEIVMLKKTIL